MRIERSISVHRTLDVYSLRVVMMAADDDSDDHLRARPSVCIGKMWSCIVHRFTQHQNIITYIVLYERAKTRKAKCDYSTTNNNNSQQNNNTQSVATVSAQRNILDIVNMHSIVSFNMIMLLHDI